MSGKPNKPSDTALRLTVTDLPGERVSPFEVVAKINLGRQSGNREAHTLQFKNAGNVLVIDLISSSLISEQLI